MLRYRDDTLLPTFYMLINRRKGYANEIKVSEGSGEKGDMMATFEKTDVEPTENNKFQVSRLLICFRQKSMRLPLYVVQYGCFTLFIQIERCIMTLQDRAEKAVQLKTSGGFNCSQAVTAVLSDQTNLTDFIKTD